MRSMVEGYQGQRICTAADTPPSRCARHLPLRARNFQSERHDPRDHAVAARRIGWRCQ